MTAAKIAITLPEEQLERARTAVRTGRADSVSGYITRALVEQERRESLQALLRDLIIEHGKPTKKETAWARRALGPKRRRV
jgi:Arc/MetJ-type ribon-helix-helix transcriptional regulator